MQRQFELVGALAELPDRMSAWRFVRDFAAAWASPIADVDGTTDEEFDNAERRLGIQLPTAVREAYRLLGRRTDLTSLNGRLLAPDEFEYDRANTVLIFRAAHQNVAFFGVSLSDPASEDPPTLMYETMMDKTQEAWVPFMTRFSLACVDMVLWESVEAGVHSDGRDQVDGEPESLVAGLNLLPFPRYPGDFDSSRWYGSSDVLLRDDDGAWVAMSARNQNAIDEFRTAHPGRWVNV